MQGKGWNNPQDHYGRPSPPIDPFDRPDFEIPDESETGTFGRHIPSYTVPTQASKSQAHSENAGIQTRLKPGLPSLTLSKLSDDSRGPIKGIRTAKNILIEPTDKDSSPVDRSPWTTTHMSSPFQTHHVPHTPNQSEYVYNVDDAVNGMKNSSPPKPAPRKGSAEDLIWEIIRLEEEIQTLVSQREHLKGETSNFHSQLAMLQDKTNRVAHAHTQVCENLKTVLHKHFKTAN